MRSPARPRDGQSLEATSYCWFHDARDRGKSSLYRGFWQHKKTNRCVRFLWLAHVWGEGAAVGKGESSRTEICLGSTTNRCVLF